MVYQRTGVGEQGTTFGKCESQVGEAAVFSVFLEGKYVGTDEVRQLVTIKVGSCEPELGYQQR